MCHSFTFSYFLLCFFGSVGIVIIHLPTQERLQNFLSFFQHFLHKSRISQRILKILTCTAKHIFSPVFNGARLFVIFRQEEIHHFRRNLTSKQAHHCPTHEVDPPWEVLTSDLSKDTCREIPYTSWGGAGNEFFRHLAPFSVVPWCWGISMALS